MRLVAAVLATAVGGTRQAGQWCDGPVHGAQQRTNVDLFWILQYLVAAIAATAAGDVARRLERQQDLLQELARQLFLFAKLADLQAQRGLRYV